MSENIQIIDKVNVTSTEVKCPGCGATIGIVVSAIIEMILILLFPDFFGALL